MARGTAGGTIYEKFRSWGDRGRKLKYGVDYGGRARASPGRGRLNLHRTVISYPCPPTGITLVGDFVATHALWVSPRNRQEVTKKRWRA